MEALMKEVRYDGIVNNVSIGTGVGNDSNFYKTIDTAPMAYGQIVLSEYLNHLEELE